MDEALNIMRVKIIYLERDLEEEEMRYRSMNLVFRKREKVLLESKAENSSLLRVNEDRLQKVFDNRICAFG